jgi:ABC-type multidrug transport system fused ATPase/permease subunit
MHVAISLVYVWTSKQLVDVATSRAEGNIYVLVAMMVGCIASQILLSAVVSRMEVETEIDLKNRLRFRMFSHIMDSSWSGGGKMHTGDVMNRLLSDVDNVASTICVVVPQTLVTCVQFVAALTFLSVLDYRLALAVTIILPAFMLFSRFYARRIRGFTKQIRDMDSNVQAHIQEYMHHRTLVASMEYTQQVVDDLELMQSDLREKIMHRTHFTLFSRKMMQAGFSAGYMSAFLWGVSCLRKGASYGTMTAFMQLAGQVQRPLMELSRQLPSFIHVTTSVDRLAAIATLPKEERGEGTNLGNEVGLRMQNVSFRYEDGVNVMDDFSFDFKPCTITAVMGRTGVGKSTLMRMVLGLISPQEGEVTFYNNGEQASASALTRCNVAYVPQGNSLVSGTVRSNLLLGNPSASEEQMLKALHTAVADFVLELPDGLDTVCGEGGTAFSEGQAQRIAIARGLLRERSIVLMDEPTAALDVVTEQLLLERLGEYSRHRTLIIVTHHGATAKLCNAVVSVG